MSLQLTRAALAGVVVVAWLGAGPAFAADAKQIADSLVAAVTAKGKSQATFENASATGDDVTITGYKMTSEDGTTVTVPTILISSAKPRDKGGFTAARVTFDNGTALSDGTTVTWKTGSVTDATVPSPEEIKSDAHNISPFSRIDVASLNVSGGDLAAPIDIASVGLTIQVTTDGTPKDFTMNVNSINVPAALYAEEPQAKAMIDALGYDGFVVNVNLAGGYETATDTVTLRGFTIDTVDAGKLSVEGKFTGVPLSKLANESTANDVAATGKLDTLTIRFDNAGIVERALDMQAKMMGGSREDVVNQIAPALPFMLTAIGNQGFQDKLAAAAQTFLKDPKSIAITAKPAEAVPFSKIMTTAQEAPQTLPDVLVVDVVANN